MKKKVKQLENVTAYAVISTLNDVLAIRHTRQEARNSRVPNSGERIIKLKPTQIVR